MTLAVAILVVIRGFLLRPIQMITERFASLAQEQLYLGIVWAGPLLVLATAIALLLVAMA